MNMSRREPVFALFMRRSFKIHDSMLSLTESCGSKIVFISIIQIYPHIKTVLLILTMLSGLSGKISVMIHLFPNQLLLAMIPHMALNKVYRCKIRTESIAQNQNWWFLFCDQCSRKDFEDGVAYRCSNDDCTNNTACARYKVPVMAAGDNVVVEMVFFGANAKDLVGKPADIIVAKFLGSSSSMSTEIQG